MTNLSSLYDELLELLEDEFRDVILSLENEKTEQFRELKERINDLETRIDDYNIDSLRSELDELPDFDDFVEKSDFQDQLKEHFDRYDFDLLDSSETEDKIREVVKDMKEEEEEEEESNVVEDFLTGFIDHLKERRERGGASRKNSMGSLFG